MRKVLLILSFILFLTSISLIGYKLVSGNKEIPISKNILEKQKEQEKYLSPYGYTIDNPNIIVDPYKISPLTALIMFETPTEEEITINIKEKDNTIKFTNTYKKNTKHYIPVYGLYSDYENKIELKYKNIIRTYTIKTDKLPKKLIINPIISNQNELTFLNNDGYIYALDSNNEVRWYLTENYNYNIKKLSNGNFIIPTSITNTNGYPIGFQEIDLLGKIYKQYNIKNGYYGDFVEKNQSYIILSKNLLELDIQTGNVLNEIKLEDKYNNINYNKDIDNIILENETINLTINLKTKETTKEYINSLPKNQELNTPIYTKNYYTITKGIEFNDIEKAKESNKNIIIINYKKIDKNYKKYNIKINQEKNLLELTGEFNDEEVYLILDKFLDKRVYKIKNNKIIINTNELKGKYSIYIKINKNIYKTNTYLNI